MRRHAIVDVVRLGTCGIVEGSGKFGKRTVWCSCWEICKLDSLPQPRAVRHGVTARGRNFTLFVDNDDGLFFPEPLLFLVVVVVVASGTLPCVIHFFFLLLTAAALTWVSRGGEIVVVMRRPKRGRRCRRHCD